MSNSHWGLMPNLQRKPAPQVTVYAHANGDQIRFYLANREEGTVACTPEGDFVRSWAQASGAYKYRDYFEGVVDVGYWGKFLPTVPVWRKGSPISGTVGLLFSPADEELTPEQHYHRALMLEGC